MIFIYLLINKLNNKKYIGQTININKRFNRHKNANGGCHKLYNSIKKHGWNNFEYSILEIHYDSYEANNAEIYWIAKLDTINTGYNILPGGIINGPRTGQKNSKEHNEKISKAHKGKIKSAEHRKNISLAQKGKPGHRRSFTILQVEDIRKEYSLGNISYSKLAKKYKVAKTTIANIIKGIGYVY